MKDKRFLKFCSVIVVVGIIVSLLCGLKFNDYISADTVYVLIDETNFPDENFRNFILSNYDLDSDAALSPTEIRAVTSLNLSGYGNPISDLTGYEYFTNVTYFNISGHNITNPSVIDLTDFTKLRYALRELPVETSDGVITFNCIFDESNRIYGYTYGPIHYDYNSGGMPYVIYENGSEEDNTFTITANSGTVFSCDGIEFTATADPGMTDVMTPLGVDTSADVCEINESTFPNEHFREYILFFADFNFDGHLSQNEIDAMVYINASNRDIDNFTGVEFFHNLRVFNAAGNTVYIGTCNLADDCPIETVPFSLTSFDYATYSSTYIDPDTGEEIIYCECDFYGLPRPYVRLTSTPVPTEVAVEPEPTSTPEPTSVPVITSIPEPTSTPVPTSTPTSVPSPAITIAVTITPIPTSTVAPTTLPIVTEIPTVTAIATPTIDPAVTATPTPTVAATATPTNSLTPTASPTVTVTPSPTEGENSGMFDDSDIDRVFDESVNLSDYEHLIDLELDATVLFSYSNNIADGVIGEKSYQNFISDYFYNTIFGDDSLSDDDFIARLYDAFAGRQASTEEASYWREILSVGTSRMNVYEQFLDNGSAISIEVSGVDETEIENYVTRIYMVCLNHQPDVSSVTFWVEQIQSRNQLPEAVARTVFCSTEFNSRQVSDDEFVNCLFSGILGTSPSAEDKAYWLGRLSAGISRTDVLNEFLQSDAFTTMSAALNGSPDVK